MTNTIPIGDFVVGLPNNGYAITREGSLSKVVGTHEEGVGEFVKKGSIVIQVIMNNKYEASLSDAYFTVDAEGFVKLNELILNENIHLQNLYNLNSLNDLERTEIVAYCFFKNDLPTPAIPL